MSYFDPMMVNKPFPKGWENYALHTEVNEQDHQLIQHLENTKWEYFADGGSVSYTPQEIDRSEKTRWYGLKRDVVIFP